MSIDLPARNTTRRPPTGPDASDVGEPLAVVEPVPDASPTDSGAQAGPAASGPVAGKEAAGDSWREPTGTSVLPSALLQLFGGAVTQLVDVVMAKGAFDVVINQSATISWSIAIGVTLAACLLTAGLGAEVRRCAVLGWTRRRGWAVAAMTAVWLGLGGLMFWLRLTQGTATGDPEASLRAELPVSGVVAVLYLAAGLAVASGAYRLTNPRRRAYKVAACKLAKVEERLVEVQAEQARVTAILTGWPNDQVGRLDALREAASNAIGAELTLMCDRARLTVVAQVADPAATTSLIRAPHKTGDA